jgi:hypothetical protein
MADRLYEGRSRCGGLWIGIMNWRHGWSRSWSTWGTSPKLTLFLEVTDEALNA